MEMDNLPELVFQIFNIDKKSFIFLRLFPLEGEH